MTIYARFVLDRRLDALREQTRVLYWRPYLTYLLEQRARGALGG